MKKQFSDNEIDDLMRNLVRDAGAGDETVNDIAGSPTLWWGVQRRIATQKDAVGSPWPPVTIFRRWLMIGVPVAAAILLAVAAIMMRPAEQQSGTGVVRSPGNMNEIIPTPVAPTEPGAAIIGSALRRPNIAHGSKPNTRAQRKPQQRVEISNPKPDEVRSEFIALSYAGSPESGQMVRVKVPRSMMVTLGLVAAVEKPNSLVDADVVVGDDGMTHAIRFIR
jgi:hypothetical protein